MTPRPRPLIIAVATAMIVATCGASLGAPLTRTGAAATTASPVASSPGACTAPDSVSHSPPAVRTPTVGVPADAALAARVTAAIANLVVCWNAADWTASVSLSTDAYLTSVGSTSDRAATVAAFTAQSTAGLGAESVLHAVGDARSHGNGFASAEVEWRHGNAAKHDRWHFVEVDGVLLLDAIRELEPPNDGDAVGIEATIDSIGLSISRNRVVNPGIIVIHVRNVENKPNVLSVLRVPSLADLTARIANPPAAQASDLAGEIAVPPMTEADLVLVDLADDEYTLVVGLRTAGGTLRVDRAYAAALSVATI